MSDASDSPLSSEPDDVSLDALSEAYAQAMGRSPEPWAESPPEGDERPPAAADGPAPPSPEHPAATSPEEVEPAEEDDDPCPISPTTILEAMLFVGDIESQPLSAVKAAELMRGVSPGEIPGLVDGLNRRYAASGCPYRIVSEGAGYRITLHKRFQPIRNKFYGRVREARLSQAALDVLAIVAYRQPITAEDVTRLRDHPSGHILSQLVRRQLLRIDRAPGKRRPLTYRTTDRFLDLFGLESLDDLPQAEDLENR